MPMQSGKSPIASKLSKLDGAIKSRAGEAVKQGFQKLPGGIQMGVARLVECGFKEYGADTNMKRVNGTKAVGELYWRATGVVESPEFATLSDGTEAGIKGLQTSIMFSAFDTKDTNGKVTTAAEHVAKITDEVCKLAGIDVVPEDADCNWLQGLCDDLVKAEQRFRFTTSEGKKSPQYPNPRVFENWNGTKGLENGEPDGSNSDGGGVDDSTQTPEPEASNGDQAEPGEIDFDGLAEAADDQDNEDAKKELGRIALEAGIEEKDVDACNNWREVAELINNAGQDAAADESPAEPEAPPEPEPGKPKVPAKGEIYGYQPMDPKTKKPAVILNPKTKKTSAKILEVQVTAVDTKKKTVALKDTNNAKTTFVGIPWDALVDPPTP